MTTVKDTSYIVFNLNQLGKGWFRWKPSLKRFGKTDWAFFWLNYRITKKVTTREI